MSAPDPVHRQVWASLVTALQGIAAGADYHHTTALVTTDLVSLLALSSQQCPALIVMAASDGAQRVFHMAGQIRDTYPFVLEGRIDAPGLTTDAQRDAYCQFLLDIEYALTRDITRGGVAAATCVQPAKGPFIGLGNSGTVLFQQRVDVIVVRMTGER